MASTDDKLGGRLRLRSVSELDAAQRDTYEIIERSIVPMAERAGFRVRLDDGCLIGPFNAFLVSPQIGAAYLRLSAQEATETSLDERVRQIVIMTIGAAWDAPYELYAHTAAGRSTGFSEDLLDALRAGRAPADISPREEIARRFAQALSASRGIEADLYAQARDAFGDKGLVDLAFLVGSYLFTSAVLNAFEVPAPLGDIAEISVAT